MQPWHRGWGRWMTLARLLIFSLAIATATAAKSNKTNSCVNLVGKTNIRTQGAKVFCASQKTAETCGKSYITQKYPPTTDLFFGCVWTGNTCKSDSKLQHFCTTLRVVATPVPPILASCADTLRGKMNLAE